MGSSTTEDGLGSRKQSVNAFSLKPFLLNGMAPKRLISRADRAAARERRFGGAQQAGDVASASVASASSAPAALPAPTAVAQPHFAHVRPRRFQRVSDAVARAVREQRSAGLCPAARRLRQYWED
eukprot:2649030-Alexandrium_andersonii.AAC.1